MSELLDEFWQAMLAAKPRFGLESQGHVPTILRLLRYGADWEQIGQVIGWCPKTAEEHWNQYVEKQAAKEQQ